MKITEIEIKNFKGFGGTHKLELKNSLVFFVGNNNTGKSTIFEAIDFLKTGLPQGKNLSDIKKKGAKDECSVTVKFSDNISEVVSDFSEPKYSKYIYEEGGLETLKAQRTSETRKIKQSGKEVEINIKKITLWNEESQQYENPSGIDTVFKTLFEAQFIWADTNPSDISDFGSTKICGRLLSSVIGDFFQSPQWASFSDIHDQTFHKGKDSLASRTRELEEDIQNIIQEQFGKVGVKFNFQLPDATSFIKSGGINIDDGTDTSSKDKGTGMQRALALALIQLYADQLCKHPVDPEKRKPLFLFIDEPETFLHPLAQAKLLEALEIISSVQQIFVTTHSPYLLKSFNSKKHTLFIFSKDVTTNKAEESDKLCLFGASSPTWGEINYFAYGLTTVEFHNELYGFLQAKASLIDLKYENIKYFEPYLNSLGLSSSKNWIVYKAGAAQSPVSSTLQTYIRNFIHHPENTCNATYTRDELEQSISEMIPLL